MAPRPLSVEAFPGAAAILSGFDAEGDDREWAIGDQALFGLRLQKGDEVQCWLMHLRVQGARQPKQHGTFKMQDGTEVGGIEFDLNNYGTQSFTGQQEGEPFTCRIKSLLLPVAVTIYDGSGQQLGSSQVQLPADVLGRGLLPSIDAGLAFEKARLAGKPMAAAARAALRQPMLDGYVCLMSIVNLVQEDDVLAQYFWQVVQKPGVWSVLTSLGVQVSTSMQLERSVPAAMPATMPYLDRAMVLPLRIDVNGEPALFVDVLATTPRRPLALCGGMVAAAARHPTDGRLHFDVQLLASRRDARK